MELGRLRRPAASTEDIDVVFRGAPREMLDALEEAFARPYGSFSFRRKGPVEDIRETGSRRLFVQVSFASKDWQTLQVEVARPEATEPELVPVAIGIADFKLGGPERVACLALSRGETEDELVADAQKHIIEDVHPDLAAKVTRDDLIAMAEKK